MEAGQVIDKWVVERSIARGGMAEVWQVRHRDLGSRQALKVLAVARADLRERLLVEGRIQAELHHPNLARVSDVLEVEGRPALVMEYVDGPSMDRWLAERRPGLAEAEAVFRGVVAGMAHAHDQGLVHRDLKPGNVLLLPVGGGLHPKVTDFGVAKVLHEASDRAGTAAILGTPRYMAPEQFRDTRGADRRADVWALGCILFELLAGRPPFDGDDPIALHAAAEAGRRDDVRALVPGVPERLARVVDLALEPDRERRPEDAGALLRLLDGADAPARPRADPTLELDGPAPLGRSRLSPGPDVKEVSLTDDAARERAEREIRVLREVAHPALVPLREVETGPSRVRIVRDVPPGRSLTDELAERRYSPDEVLARLETVLDLLVYLHGLSPPILVRDLSPDRFWVARDGQLLLADLGLVRDTLPDPLLGGATFEGTFGYMAPEQFRGESTPATDVYGAGVLGVHLASRRLPSELERGGRLEWEPWVEEPVAGLLGPWLSPDPATRPSARAALAQLRRLRAPAPRRPDPSSDATRAPAPALDDLEAGARLADALPGVDPEPFHQPPIIRPHAGVAGPGRTGSRRWGWLALAAFVVTAPLLALALNSVPVAPDAPAPAPAAVVPADGPVEAAVRRGRDALLAAEYAPAVRAFETAVDADPRHAEAQVLLGWSAWSLGDPSRATWHLELAAAESGVYADLARATLAALREDVAPAHEWLRAHPDDPLARTILAEATGREEWFVAAEEALPTQALPWARHAASRLNAGFPIDADHLLATALAENGRSPELHAMQAVVRLASGELDLAAASATRALELDPGSARAIALLAEVDLARGDTAARQAAVAAALAGPSAVPFGALHAEALARHGHVAEAMRLYADTAARAEQAGDWGTVVRARTAILQLREHALEGVQPASAEIEALEQALTSPELSHVVRDLGTARALYFRGMAEARAGDPVAAAKIADRLEKLGRTPSAVALIRSEIALRAGQPEQAIAALERVGGDVARARTVRLLLPTDPEAASLAAAWLLPHGIGESGPARAALVAESILAKAEAALAAGSPESAALWLDQLRERWPTADPDLPVMRRAADLERRLRP